MVFIKSNGTGIAQKYLLCIWSDTLHKVGLGLAKSLHQLIKRCLKRVSESASERARENIKQNIYDFDVAHVKPCNRLHLMCKRMSYATSSKRRASVDGFMMDAYALF